MRRVLLFMIAAMAMVTATVIGSGVSYSDPVKTDKQPALEVTPLSVDFGTVNEGEKPKAVFTIKNNGSADLIIYDAKPSCGCTVANLSSKKVAPGDKATLEAVYNSTNGNGQIHKSVILSTNDPKGPSVNLSITGFVKAMPGADITLSAYNAPNLQLPVGGTTTRSVKITNTGQLDLVINELTASKGISAVIDKYTIAPGQTVKPAITLKPGETKLLDITIAPVIKTGTFQELIAIRSNAKHRAVVTFIAQGVVQG